MEQTGQKTDPGKTLGVKPRLQLQQRDKDILRYCYEQQFLLSSHIARYFFKGANPRTSFENCRA